MTKTNAVIYRTGTKESKVVVGESHRNLSNYAPLEKSVLFTDPDIYGLYKESLPDIPVVIIEKGEKNKSLQTAEYLYGKLLEYGCDRSSYIIGVGGGIVTDITGYVASTFMRGIGFGFVSTTLLSQVDASVGGKNGVNFMGYKNMVGTFNQPDFVLCDTGMLDTLPTAELESGFAEIVKHALIADEELYHYILENIERMKKGDRDVIHHLVHRSVEIKTDVVTKDEREGGLRRILNFGHTLGHALEKTTGISHGRGVALGMEFGCKLSLMKGYLTIPLLDEIQSILKSLNLLDPVPVDREALLEALLKDKKKETDSIYFVLIEHLGRAIVEKISIDQLKEQIDALCQYC